MSERGKPARERGALHREDELGTTGSKREEESREPRDKPHVVEGEGEGSVQEDHDESGAGKRPSLPATAHGEDRVEGGEGVDPESMYERRPEEDKDVSPEDVAEGKERS